MKEKHRLSFSAILILALTFLSCSEDRIFEEFKAIENESWNEQDTVSFSINLSQEETGPQLIGVRFNEDYPFSNLYLRYISQDSSGIILENKLLNIPLFDSKLGSPLGKGFGNTFTKFDTLPFPIKKGTASISMIQYMRKEEVQGIEAIGVKILNK
ncbi:gliding motility lipoprotein GldH [Algoriphagus mannitolivorans]|uniref:gliding motility lipoprotein GldH n=1 Tax=Algoriphagus mannitolivorans TaxID=226504 RepID=UPI000478EA7E|nr:gliding motility lipoprotein GldH [Algoriphagus mannitolivorans]